MELHSAVLLSRDASNGEQELIFALLKGASVENIESLGDGLRAQQELLRQVQIILSHVTREVRSDTALMREVDLRVGCIICEDFDCNLVLEPVQRILDKRVLLVGFWVRMKNGPELLRRDLRNELHVAERVIVTQVAVEAASVCDEVLPLLWSQALHVLECSRLKLVKVLFCEVGLEDAPDERLLIADLV